MAVSEALHTPRVQFPFSGEYTCYTIWGLFGLVRIPDSYIPHETYTGTRIEDGLTHRRCGVYNATSS